MATVAILLSDKRSGSTMLQDELRRHPDIQRVDYSPHTYFETHHWLKAAVLLRRPDALYGDGRTYEGYGGRRNARAYMVDLLTRNVPEFTAPDDDEALVFEGWEALCGRYARPVFFEKSPQVLAHWAALDLLLEWRERTAHSVKLIGLVRNPLAVQHSAEALFQSDPEVRQLSWLRTQRNLLAVREMTLETDFRLFRYEDVVAEPQETLAQICAFIGVEPHPAVGEGVHGRSREKWAASDGFTLQLDRSVARIARSLGYSGEELANANRATAGAAARRSAPRRWRRAMTRLRDRLLRPVAMRLRRGLPAAR